MTRRLGGQPLQVIPAARRLIESLRDVGYDFVTAVADLVDNSVAAGATEVSIELVFDGPDSAVLIEDNGTGMSGTTITEAMRFGSHRDYRDDDLGKFGLGLKTASLSQCRRLTVASRTSAARRQVEVRVMDLDHIAATDRWEVLRVPAAEHPPLVVRSLQGGPGTVVIWERLDRILAYHDPWGERANRKLRSLAEQLDQHLGMVFHRFLTPPGSRGRLLTMSLNGTKIDPWDPFVHTEPHLERLPEREFEIAAGQRQGLVRFRPFVLPPQQKFTSTEAWQRTSGPRQWNRQQGFYIYRGDRIIQGGSWSWMRTPDEHTKLARASVEFWPWLDGAFEVNVTKTRVKLPDDLRTLLKQPVQDLVRRANTVYRQADAARHPPRPSAGTATTAQPARLTAPASRQPDTATRRHPAQVDSPSRPGPASEGTTAVEAPTDAGPAADDVPGDPTTRPNLRVGLEDAARAVGEHPALERIIGRLRSEHPEVARELGWS